MSYRESIPDISSSMLIIPLLLIHIRIGENNESVPIPTAPTAPTTQTRDVAKERMQNNRVSYVCASSGSTLLCVVYLVHPYDFTDINMMESLAHPPKS